MDDFRRWLGAGVLAFFVSVSQVGAAESGEFDLHVMTYNIKGLIIKRVNHNRYREIGKILAQRRKEGTAPKIVVLQEAFHRRTKELNRAAGYPYVARGPGARYPFRTSAGLLILSEYPIRHVRTLVYGKCGGFDCLSRKGVVGVSVDIPGVPFPVEVFNTHMQAVNERGPSSPERVHVIQRYQIRQIRRFLEWNDWMNDAPTALQLFMGDFNFRGTSEKTYPYMYEQTGFADIGVMCVQNPDVCQADQWMIDTAGKGVDHVRYRTNALARQVEVIPLRFSRTFAEPLYQGKPLSDHKSIEGVIKIRW